MKNCLAKYNYTKKIRLSRLWYYLISLLKLYRAIKLKSFFQFTLQLFAGDTKIVHLRNYDLKFKLKSMLDVLTLKEVVIDDEYESLGVRIDKKDKVIVDIGAGFGDFAILVSKRHPLAKIFAFEPDPFYFGLLKENIKLNKARNIFPFKESIFSLKQVFNPIQSNPIQSNLFSSM